MMLSFQTLIYGVLIALAIPDGLPVTPLLATLAEKVPGIFYGLPLVALASLIFAATHHEDPAEIRFATVHRAVWLGGILGTVFVAVVLIGWMA